MLALDVTDLKEQLRGDKVINGLMSSKGRLYRTARGRLAIQIEPAVFARIKAQLKITLTEGQDGTQLVGLQG
jgi:hypothetical protein